MERQELVERLVLLGQGTMVLTGTPVMLVITAQPELEVRQGTQETLAMLGILEVLVAADHEVPEELLEVEVMGEPEHPLSELVLELMVILVAQMETETVLVTGVLEAPIIKH